MHEHTIVRRSARIVAAVLSGLLTSALRADAALHVERGVLLEDGSGVLIKAIERPGLGDPEISLEDFERAFVEISNVGARSLCIHLEGFSEDGSAWDTAYRDQTFRVMSENGRRWLGPVVVRVLGTLEDASHDVRVNAARAVARELRDRTNALYWIDGPRSGEIAQAFRKTAGKLVVASPEGGHLKTIRNLDEMVPGVPSVMIGSIPSPYQRIGHCILPAEPESYRAFELVNRHRRELQPWHPSDTGLTEAEKAAGFVSLFDGRSFDGWTIMGANQNGFAIEDGAIVWKARGGHSVRTNRRYADFVLRLQFAIHEENGNSGLFLRAPRANRASRMGMEFQIMGDHGTEPHPNGTGAIYDVVAPIVNAAKPAGEWNDVEIRMDGPHVMAVLNGQLVHDIMMDDFDLLRYRNREGFIALQDHNDPVSFRNIRILELKDTP
jgi:hypothetical protein